MGKEMTPFSDFRKFHPVPGVCSPGTYFASADGKCTVMFTVTLHRDGETSYFVDVTINGDRTRIYGEEAYYDWKRSRPLPGHRNGWY
jgi:hypothetical protein